MLKILWKREEIAPLLSTIFCYLMIDFYVETRIRFSLRDKRLFEITEVELTRVDYISYTIIVVCPALRANTSESLWVISRTGRQTTV